MRESKKSEGGGAFKAPPPPGSYRVKLYYKLYRNTRLPAYFENFIPEYGESNYNLRNRHIHLPDVRCEFGKVNAKYQMHLRLRELAIPSNSPIYPLIDINDEVNHFLIFLAILNLCLPRLITLNAILITIMYVKIQFRFVLFVCVMLF